jgi:hypothetical protein
VNIITHYGEWREIKEVGMRIMLEEDSIISIHVLISMH